jgi:SAM-dependent methyltransferase
MQNKFLNKDFWIKETDICRQSNLRHIKCVRIINSIVGNSACDILDVGCGPATLGKLLGDRIHYYGIDIAIHEPAPNLRETDVIKNTIKFEDKKFDVVVALGLFEYMGQFQQRKLSEICGILKDRGKFIASYTNFDHLHATTDYAPFNNIMPIKEFKYDLELHFKADRFFPIYHNWNGNVPWNKWSILVNKYVDVNIPLFSPKFAVGYFFICSLK